MLQLLSPAKINLFLRITGRRSDGYHTLQTAFQFLDYCDVLNFQKTTTGKIKRVDDAEKYPNDLILKAAKLLQQKTNSHLGAIISLQKNIPDGGGLGGGSSNAATTLIALNEIWDLKLSSKELMKIGLELGADVPVFIFGKAAFAEGIGEVLTAIKPPENWYLVVNPNIKISTKEIFSAKELTRDSPSLRIRTLSNVEGENDCVLAVTKRYPAVNEALIWLGNYGIASLTGTGACIFTSFTNKNEAKSVLSKLPKKWGGFVAKGKNLSSLYEKWGVAKR